jgi:hypothetical protein
VAIFDDIKSYYVNILQREPSDDEVNGWAAPVNSGALTIDQVRKAFIDSPEAQHVAGVIRLYQAAFDRVPDQGGLKAWVQSGLSLEQIADGFASSEEFTNRYGTNPSREAFVTSLYYQVLGRAPDAGGLAAWTNSGQSFSEMLAGFGKSEEFQIKTTAAVATFLDNAGKGTEDYSGKLIEDAPVTEPEIPSQAFTLTTSVVSTEGGEGKDSVSGLIDTTASSLTSTLQAGDVIDLKGDIDTANITLVNNHATGVSAGWQMNNVEVINVNSVDGNAAAAHTATINLAGAAQTTEVWNKGGSSGAAANSDTVAFTDVAKGTLIGVQKVSNVNTSATFATIATSGTDDTVSIAVDGISSTDTTDGKITIAAGFEKAHINSAGAASKIGALSFGGTVKELSITADQDLTITSALDASIVKVSAGEFSGDLSIVAGNVADAGGSPDGMDLTIVSGSGSDTINVSGVDASKEFSVSTGAGDDRIVVGVNLDTADIVDGGEGTDTLSLSVADAGTFATDLSKNVKGIDVLELTTATGGASTHTLNVAGTKLGVTQLVSAASEAGDTTNFTGVAANSTLTIKSNVAAVGATIGTNTSADVINVVLDGVTTGAVTATNYETVNLTSQKDTADNTNSLAALTASTATSLNLSGSADLVGGTVTLAASAAVDATGFSGKITGATFASNLKSYLGGSSDDVITVKAGNIGTGVTLDGGLGDKDILNVTGSANQNAGLLNVKGFETVNLKVATTFTGDFRNVTDLATLKLDTTAITDDVTLNRLSDSTLVEITKGIGDVTMDLAAGSAHSVKSSGTPAYTIEKLALDAAATELNFEASVTNGSGTTITSLVGTSLNTMNVKGDGHLVMSGPATLETVNASEMKGNLSVTLTAASGNLSVTGGEGNDTINVAANVSATGANTLTGGKGVDTFTLGVGSKDTVVLNAGDAVVVDAVNTDVASVETVVGFTVADDSFKIGNNVAAADFGSTAIVFTTGTGSIGGVTVTDAAADFTGATAKFMDALESLVALGGTNALKANGVQTFAVSGLTVEAGNNGTYAFIDEDGVAGYTAGVDSIIKIGGVPALTHADFIA